jgi:uncharacterized membrane protein
LYVSALQEMKVALKRRSKTKQDAILTTARVFSLYEVIFFRNKLTRSLSDLVRHCMALMTKTNQCKQQAGKRISQANWQFWSREDHTSFGKAMLTTFSSTEDCIW